ncbi:MAG: hypothetical protein ISR00_05285 [Flavobacteriales bacterium]|nr:hypothetical protein [Flavobacteriales bacterium]MBL6873347.1 hypothetical protein [Flavobacteriales bacterium]
MKQLIFLLLAPFYLFGQMSVKIDTDTILIGDQIKLSVESNSIEGELFPNFNDSIGPLEILSKSNIDSISSDSGLLIRQYYTLTAWDSGVYFIPSIKYGNSVNDSIPIYVNTIELGQDDELKDIKAPIQTPITFDEASPYILGFLIILGIILLIRYWLKNRTKKELTPVIKEEIIPPHLIALNKLEILNAKKLWQNGKVKEYYTTISEVIRTYIEDGIGTPAMEIPTKEIITQLNQQRIETSKLEELLMRSDLAKFAKSQPLEIENEESYKIAIDFINITTKSVNENDVE